MPPGYVSHLFHERLRRLGCLVRTPCARFACWLWFVADKPGKSVATCTMYCGLAHSKMYSDVVAVPASEFHAWMDSKVRQVRATTDSSRRTRMNHKWPIPNPP